MHGHPVGSAEESDWLREWRDETRHVEADLKEVKCKGLHPWNLCMWLSLKRPKITEVSKSVPGSRVHSTNEIMVVLFTVSASKSTLAAYQFILYFASLDSDFGLDVKVQCLL